MTDHAADFVRPVRGGVRLRLRVSPGARHTAFNGLYGKDAAKLAVAAPPVDGKANAEIVRFLARALEVPRGSVELASGASGRNKTILVRGIGETTLRERLRPLIS